MARGRPWTEAEDYKLWGVVNDNRRFGPVPPVIASLHDGNHTSRLHAFAHQIGRSYAAVRKRASRIGLRTYRKNGQWV